MSQEEGTQNTPEKNIVEYTTETLPKIRKEKDLKIGTKKTYDNSKTMSKKTKQCI